MREVRYCPGSPMEFPCGALLTPETWRGWPIRVTHLGPSGSAERLVCEHDSVLVWSGGRSQVTLLVQGRHELARRDVLVRAGTIDLVARGTVLESVSWQGQPCTCLSIAFEPAPLERALGRTACFTPEELRLGLPDAHVVDLVHRLQAQARNLQPWGSTYVEALSLALASYVYGKYAQDAAPGEDDSRLAALEWDRLIAFVDDNLGRRVRTSDLARVMGYSRDHFSRLFKQAFGVTPHQYVLERRVEHAKSLLRIRTHSIAEVATACGFSTQAHLYTAFKARTGITPGAYRRG